MEIDVPQNDELALVEEGSLSILSIAAEVKMPFFNVFGCWYIHFHTVDTIDQHICFGFAQASCRRCSNLLQQMHLLFPFYESYCESIKLNKQVVLVL